MEHEGSSSVVAAHLTTAKNKGWLLERFAHAEASCPKLIDLTGGMAEVRVINDDPEKLLDSTMRALGAARFTFPSDRDMACTMMEDFEWTIKTAIEQAMAQDPTSGGLTVPPSVARQAERGLLTRHRHDSPSDVGVTMMTLSTDGTMMTLSTDI